MSAVFTGNGRESPRQTTSSARSGHGPLRPELEAPLGVWPSSQLIRCAGGRTGWRLSGDVAVRCCCTAPAPSAKTPSAVLAGRPSAFRQVTRRGRPGPTRRPRPRAILLTPSRPHTTPMPNCPWNLPRDCRTFQGMAPYPGQARCLALGFWPECFQRLNVKGGRRPFPKETRSALDIEGKHVTIQRPSPGLSPAAALAASARATWMPSLQIRRYPRERPDSFRTVCDLGRVSVGCP